MANLSISNVINIQVSATPSGLGEFNTGNLAIFTHEVPGEEFGSDAYKTYLTASEVAQDFGSDAITTKMANAVFAQSPNILSPGGSLKIFPLGAASSKITFSNEPDAGTATLYYGDDADHVSGTINYNSDATAVQTALRAIPALAKATVTGDFAEGFVITVPGDLNPALHIKTNTLNLNNDDTTLTFTVTGVETIAAALARTTALTPYVGILTTHIIDQTELLAAAAAIQADYKVGFFPGTAAADIEVGGKLDLLRSGGFNRTRGLYYGLSSEGALIFAAAYASRGMSVNYSGSNTTLTMNLKDLATVPVDTTMTQTLKGKAEAAGADIYASIEGLSKVLSFGANKYFDQVFNLIWFCKKLEIDCFNYLAMSSTKVPQTEMGADGFDNVCRKVCAQAVLNAYAAPGEWTISDTFGDPATFKQNITEQGYYVWHSPVANQSAAERAGRKLPLCQVALKEAGAVHGASVLVYINA